MGPEPGRHWVFPFLEKSCSGGAPSPAYKVQEGRHGADGAPTAVVQAARLASLLLYPHQLHPCSPSCFRNGGGQAGRALGPQRDLKAGPGSGVAGRGCHSHSHGALLKVGTSCS